MDRNSGRGSRRDPRNRGGGSDEPFGGVSETKGRNGMTKVEDGRTCCYP